MHPLVKVLQVALAVVRMLSSTFRQATTVLPQALSTNGSSYCVQRHRNLSVTAMSHITKRERERERERERLCRHAVVEHSSPGTAWSSAVGQRGLQLVLLCAEVQSVVKQLTYRGAEEDIGAEMGGLCF